MAEPQSVTLHQNRKLLLLSINLSFTLSLSFYSFIDQYIFFIIVLIIKGNFLVNFSVLLVMKKNLKHIFIIIVLVDVINTHAMSSALANKGV